MLGPWSPPSLPPAPVEHVKNIGVPGTVAAPNSHKRCSHVRVTLGVLPLDWTAGGHADENREVHTSSTCAPTASPGCGEAYDVIICKLSGITTSPFASASLHPGGVLPHHRQQPGLSGGSGAVAQHPTRSAADSNGNWLLYGGELREEAHLGRRLTGALLVLSFPRSLDRLASLPVSSGQKQIGQAALTTPSDGSRLRVLAPVSWPTCDKFVRCRVDSKRAGFRWRAAGLAGVRPVQSLLEPDKKEWPEVIWIRSEHFPVFSARKHASEHWVQVTSIRPRAHRTYSDFGTLATLPSGHKRNLHTPPTTSTKRGRLCLASALTRIGVQT